MHIEMLEFYENNADFKKYVDYVGGQILKGFQLRYVYFIDKASRANKNGMACRVPVQLSKPMNEACTVGYTVWDYDAGTVLQTGSLHFDRLETNQAISVDANGRNVLIEISSVQNVARGENSFHYIAAANGQSR